MNIDLTNINPKTIDVINKLLFHAVDQMKVNKQARMYYHSDDETIDQIELFRTKLALTNAAKEVGDG